MSSTLQGLIYWLHTGTSRNPSVAAGRSGGGSCCGDSRLGMLYLALMLRVAWSPVSGCRLVPSAPRHLSGKVEPRGAEQELASGDGPSPGL